MPHYMLGAYTRQDERSAVMSDEQRQASWRQIQQLEGDMRSAGAWVFSARLHDPDTATVVRFSNGKIVTTDGPFAESKDHLAGFYVIEAADLDEALAWASKTAEAVGHPIEVQPFVDVALEPHG